MLGEFRSFTLLLSSIHSHHKCCVSYIRLVETGKRHAEVRERRDKMLRDRSQRVTLNMRLPSLTVQEVSKPGPMESLTHRPKWKEPDDEISQMKKRGVMENGEPYTTEDIDRMVDFLF